MPYIQVTEKTVYTTDDILNNPKYTEIKEKAIEKMRKSYHEYNEFCSWIVNCDCLFEPKHKEIVELYKLEGKEYKGTLIDHKPLKVHFSFGVKYLDASESLIINDEYMFLRWLGIPKGMIDNVFYTIETEGTRYPDTIIEFVENDSGIEFTKEQNEILDKAVKKFSDHMTDVLNSLEESYEYYFTKEAILEDIQANEWEFDEDGNIV